MGKQVFLNTCLDDLSLKQAMDRIEELIPLKSSAYVVELNVDVIVKIEEDPALRRIADEADLTLADGKPLVWISRLLGRPVPEKISGSDLMMHLCGLAAKKGYRVFLLGGTDQAARLAKERLCAAYPGLRLECCAPPMGFTEDPAECAKVNARLRAAQPDLLFVCFGCPRQEKWIAKNRESFRAGVCLCAGASVDFAAGLVKRSPKWMSNCGLEWFYRFLREPARLFRRYFVDDLQIIRLVWKYRKTT